MAKRPGKKRSPSEIARAKESLPIMSWKLFLLRVTVILAAGWWVFRPALQGDWLWDDDMLISDNALVRDPAGLWKIWFEPGDLFDYFPLTVSVEWIEWRLWHNQTFGYHLTNLVLHLIGALLMWRLFDKLGLRLAWLGGLLFAVHPVVVESVAWISEIKNTLSLPLFLGAMCAWIDYDRQGKRNDYFLALGLFLAAMLCKTTVVMFPIIILLHAWWKRGRVGWADLRASIPFLVISLGLGLITVWFLHHHAIGEAIIPVGGFFPRLALAGLSLAFYFSKCFWPVGLMTIYPKWVIDPPSLVQFLPWPILGGVICWLWINRATWGQHALFGLGFFLINLAPFLGFITGSYMNFTWVMDHLLYLPMIGLIGLTVAGLERLAGQLPSPARSCGMGIIVIVTALLAWESHGYAALYINSEKLWAHTVELNPNAWLARNNLATALFKTNQIPEAIDQYEEALKINPRGPLAHNNLGEALARVDRVPEAVEQFEQALKVNPNDAEARCNLGVAWAKSGRTSEAVEQFRAASKLQPDNVEILYNLGVALLQTNRIPEAIEQFEQIIKNNPDDADIHDKLGDALTQAGRNSEAIEQFALSLKINPDDAEVRNKLARLEALPQTSPSREPAAK